jgi:uncharacterized membrane protein
LKKMNRFHPRNQKIRNTVLSAMVAASYVVLTYLSAAMGLASHAIQCRLAEALCVLPFFMGFAAVPGLAIGCALANFLTGAVIYDVIFGSLATLLGALGAYALRKLPLRRVRFLLPVGTILANVAIVPFVLQYAYGVPDAWWFLCLTVGIGEIIAAGVGGVLMTFLLEKYRSVLFK